MAVLLDIKNASKRYGDQVLLDRASATITDDGKVGFIGRNGAGKSTLLRVILGEEELDGGEIVRHPRLRLGYLRQHDPFLPDETVLGFLERDSGRPDWKCGEVAGQFEIKGPTLAGPVHALSGGWQTRVKLAALLLHEPNLLLLDEPTNFLDLRTQILLEHFLRGFDEACLIVSHDRAFLHATCDRTLDLSRGALTTFPGKVDAFLEHQRERRLHAERSNAGVLARKRELEDFIARNKARASTASRARSKSKELERLEIEEIAADEPTAAIRCPAIQPRKGPAARCVNLAIGYGDRAVARGIDVEIVHGSRAAIVGDNGQGKTTFLRTLVDSLPPLTGHVKWGYGCELGIYAQHVYTSLPTDETVLEYLERAAAIGVKSQRILDVETVDALARALVDYAGTVIFTSHDRSFVRTVATNVVEVKDGRVINYLGSYEQYLAAINREIDDADEAAGRAAGPRKPAPPAAAAKAKPAAARSDRDLRREIGNLERSIARLDADKKRVQEKLLATSDVAAAIALHEELTAVTAKLAAAEESWLALQEQLAAADT